MRAEKKPRFSSKRERTAGRILILIAVMIVLVIGTYIGTRYFNCGMDRYYTLDRDKRIRDIKGRIDEIEKDGVKDISAMRRLADQYGQLGTIYLEERRWDQAIEALDKSISYGKDTPAIYYSAGLAYANRGSETKNEKDLDRAEAMYRKAIERYSAFSQARNALAILLFYNRDRRDEAVSIMEDVVATDRKNYLARFTLARFYYETDRPERALGVYEELYADLEKLPPSDIIEDYKNSCRSNIQRIIMEMGKKKG